MNWKTRIMGNTFSKCLSAVFCVAMIVVSVICPPLGALTPLVSGALLGAGVGGLTTLAMGGSLKDIWKSIGLGLVTGFVGAGAASLAEMACGAMSICKVGTLVCTGIARGTACCLAVNLVTGQPLFSNLGRSIIGAAFTAVVGHYVTDGICQSLTDAISPIGADLSQFLEPFLYRAAAFVPDCALALALSEKMPNFGHYMIGAAVDAARVGIVQATRYVESVYRRAGERAPVSPHDEEALRKSRIDTDDEILADDEDIRVVKTKQGLYVVCKDDADSDSQRLRTLLGDDELQAKVAKYLQADGDELERFVIGSSNTLNSVLADNLSRAANILIVDDTLPPGPTGTRSTDGRTRRLPPTRSVTESATASSPPSPSATSNTRGMGGAYLASMATRYDTLRLPPSSAIRRWRTRAESLPLLTACLSGFVSADAMARGSDALQDSDVVIVAEARRNQHYVIVVDAFTIPKNWNTLLDAAFGDITLRCVAAVLPVLCEARAVQKPREYQTKMNCDVAALKLLIKRAGELTQRNEALCCGGAALPSSTSAVQTPWAVVAVCGHRAAQAAAIRCLTDRMGYTYHEQWFSGMCPTGVWAFVCAHHRIIFLDVDMRQFRTIATAVACSSQVLLVHDGADATMEDITTLMHAMHYAVRAQTTGEGPNTSVRKSLLEQLELSNRTAVPFLVSAGVAAAPVVHGIEPDALSVLTSVFGSRGVASLGAPVDHFKPQLPHHMSVGDGRTDFSNAFAELFTSSFAEMDRATEAQIKADFEAMQKRSNAYVDKQIQAAFSKVCREAEVDEDFAEALQGWCESFTEECKGAKTIADIPRGLIKLCSMLWGWGRRALAMEVLYCGYDRYLPDDEPTGWNGAWVASAKQPATMKLIWQALQDVDLGCRTWAWRFLSCVLKENDEAVVCAWLNLKRPHDGMPLLSVAVDLLANDTPVVTNTPEASAASSTYAESYEAFLFAALQSYEGGARLTASLSVSKQYGTLHPVDVVRFFAPRGDLILYAQTSARRPRRTHTFGMRPLNGAESVDALAVAVRRVPPADVTRVALFDFVDRLLLVGFCLPEGSNIAVELSLKAKGRVRAIVVNPAYLLNLDPVAVSHGSPYAVIARLPESLMVSTVMDIESELFTSTLLVVAGMLDAGSLEMSRVYCSLLCDVLFPTASFTQSRVHRLPDTALRMRRLQTFSAAAAMLAVAASHKAKFEDGVSHALRRVAALSNFRVDTGAAFTIPTTTAVELFFLAWVATGLTDTAGGAVPRSAWGLLWVVQHGHYLSGNAINDGMPFAHPSQLPPHLVSVDVIEECWRSIKTEYSLADSVWFSSESLLRGALAQLAELRVAYGDDSA